MLHLRTATHNQSRNLWADWAAWHLPDGPVGPPARWTATSSVEVGQMKHA